MRPENFLALRYLTLHISLVERKCPICNSKWELKNLRGKRVFVMHHIGFECMLPLVMFIEPGAFNEAEI